jgi:hypothetical protein
MNDRTVTVFGGTGFLGFSAAASFGISASAAFPCGLHQGIRIEDTGCSLCDLTWLF